MASDVFLRAQVRAGDLLDALAGVGREELIELIKDLDKRMAEWDFTLPLCDYFGALKAEHEREEAEDRDKAGLVSGKKATK